jgi:hypothetical protein
MKTKYFSVDQGLAELKNPCDVASGAGTSIAGALEATVQILDEFNADMGMPDVKKVTVFLWTDGKETVKSQDEVRQQVAALRAHVLAPTVAVICLGTDADVPLLLEVADEPSERQVRHLATAGVLDLISQTPRRLFLNGHAQGALTAQQAEAIRQFVNVLSQTIGGTTK